jgi:hypothetical protein
MFGKHTGPTYSICIFATFQFFFFLVFSVIFLLFSSVSWVSYYSCVQSSRGLFAQLFYDIVLVSPQEKKVRFEGEVKEMSDDEVRSIKWDGAELKARASLTLSIIFIFGVVIT